MNRLMTMALMGLFTASIMASTGYQSAGKIELQQTTQIAKRVTKKEFYEKLNALDEVQLIDVRTPGEFKKGTINGAINYDYNSDNFLDLISKLDKSKPTLIFCQAGGRSAKALQLFKNQGFDYVLELEGGYSGWVR